MRRGMLGKAIVDLFLVYLGFLLAFLIRFGGELPPGNWRACQNLIPWITLIAVFLFYTYGLYSSERQNWEEIFPSLICVVAILFISSMALSFLLHEFSFPRSIFLISVPLQLLFLTLWRRLLWFWTMRRMGPMRLLLVGPHENVFKRARSIFKEDPKMYRVIGLLVDKPQANLRFDNTDNFPLLGTYDEIAPVLNGIKADGVLFCNDIPFEKRISMINAVISHNMLVYVIPGMYDIFISQSQLEHFDGIPVFRLSGLVKGSAKAWKRIMDVGIALVAGIVALPLVCLAALAIKLEPPSGPVFYCQDRVGRGGKIFKLIKLRTMIPDAEKHSGPVLAVEKDRRITKVGHILRITRIDELPQLWNVLKGEMSFIGPRPERPVFVNKFRKQIPGYEYRHWLQTGITGLAQVEGKYSTPPEDKLRFDLLYAKTVSPLQDIQILLHTLKVMLMKDKSS
ncbi:MAG: sugar transferase [Firmicutes bacterium]|nr:sugar transferase [Bacillota bacterium]